MLFASSALCAYFSLKAFKNDDKYLAPPEIFFAPWLCWTGYGPAAASQKRAPEVRAIFRVYFTVKQKFKSKYA